LESVNVEKGKVSLRVNPNFYSIECVKRTKKMFLESCKISIKKRKDVIEVILKPKSRSVDTKLLGYEFYNHLLNVLKEMETGI